MDRQDRALRDFRRHLATLFVLKYALPLATVYALVWGTAVLALRAAAGVERKPLLWGLLGVAACLAVAIVLARRRMPSATAIRALLDEQSGCGGLLMAGAEQELGGWRQRMPPLTPPRIQWHGRRAGTLLAIAAGFVLLSFLAPQGLADLSSSSPLEVDREIGRLLAQIALLKGESLLEPKRAETLAEKLAELSEHASGKDPARTLEALDHLRKVVGETAREAAEQSTRQNERLGDAQALAELLSRNADLLDAKMTREALSELAGLLDKNGGDPTQFLSRLDPELMKALRRQKLDPEQLRKLGESLRITTADLDRQMEKLHKAGLIDAETLAKCRGAGECDCEGLRAFLRDNKGKASLADIKSLCKRGGAGGISRGPGEAPMTWGKPGSEEGFQFKEEVLPLGALDALKSTPLQEVRGGSVVHQKSAETASSGALRGASSGSGSANTEILLPRHRASVERYFDRKSPTKK
jgi:hypothetical protein